MDIPPAVAQFYQQQQQQQQSRNADEQHQQQQQQQQHINQTPSATSNYYNNNNNNQNIQHYYNNSNSNKHSYDSNVIPHRTSSHEATNAALEMISHPLHSVVEELRRELREARQKLAHQDEERTAAVAQAKADTYVHIVKVLKQEGVPGVERLKTQYGGDAIAAQLRQGGGLMLTGGGERRNTVHVAAPSVNTDMLTKEELHTGLRKALRNL